MIVLECCVDSVESALAAVKGGADRLEICSGLPMGGLSPSPCLFQKIKEVCGSVKLHVLLRPRVGDFCYSDYEFQILLEEVRLFKKLGAHGVVIGILKPDGELDVERMKLLVDEAQGMSVTLHRAFDMCSMTRVALEEAVQLGVQTILTSGQRNSALEGADLLELLVEQAGGRITIMPGAGVSAAVLPQLLERTGAKAYHMSGKKTVPGRMVYRQPSVSMGSARMDEYEISLTDEEQVRAARTILNQWDQSGKN